MAEKGLSSIEHYMTEDHEMLKRAATECMCNMVMNEEVSQACIRLEQSTWIEFVSSLIIWGKSIYVLHFVIFLFCSMQSKSLHQISVSSYKNTFIIKNTHVVPWNQIHYKLLKISVKPNMIGTCFQDIWPEHVIKCFEILKESCF